ncbi:urease accessory protein UreD [Helicobacter baculiformis]|uniref:Urease accessory protein UreD n=1 Tax=Helicobacter baculiformis TaxID=427351 RepID=A0ABV7ZHW2_9HELI|nr:urease accessory protein UreD [Helicobacter baculiformis]
MRHQTTYAQASKLYLRTAIGARGRCVIADNYFTPPFKLMPAFHADNALSEIMLLAVSPGMLKGDAQDIKIEIGKGCRLKLSSQSFEKIFDTEDGYASRETHVVVEENALLDFSPLPIIPFANAHFKNHTEIILNPNSELLYSEIVAAGRIAHGEAFAFHKIHSTLHITYQNPQDSQLIFIDNTILDPACMDLTNPCMFDSYTHYLNMVIFTKCLQQETIQALLEESKLNAGLSALPSRLPQEYSSLCLKALACSSEPLLALRHAISQLLT